MKLNLKQLLNWISYQWEIATLTWLRPSYHWNIFNWDVVEPIKKELWKLGWIKEKPLIVVTEEYWKKKKRG